jgi:fimbrial chaperone protein
MLELRPVQLDFTPSQKAQAFALINRDARPAVIQIRPFHWSQGPTGEDQLEPTEDLIVSPPFVQLGPGESQVVRVKYLGPDPPAEAAYRLLVDQLPIATAPGIRTALCLSMPAFVAPTMLKPAQIAWIWTQGVDGARVLTVINSGGSHAMVADLKVNGPAGEPFGPPKSGSAYILGGVTRQWRIAPPPKTLPPTRVAGAP